MLEACGLIKRVLGVTIVRDITFAVRRGEIVGYLGPNGSGKTTTVRMLATLSSPSEGAVRFDGEDINANPLAFRGRLGYVPEEPYLYPFLSGREHLELVARLRGLPASVVERKLPTLLDLLGLDTAREQKISTYSKGMKQKVLIAAALLHDPDVLIFDEPESGLDVTTSLLLRHLVRALARRGKAILYSSHVLESVEKLCSRVLVLHQGRIVADDSVGHLRTLMKQDSLESVFQQLVAREDPQSVASAIVDLVAVHP